MKPGCIIKTLIISTIILAVIFYIFTHKYNEYVIAPFKSSILKFTLGKVQDELKVIPDTDEKEEVINALKEYVAYVDTTSKIDSKNIEEVSDSLQSIISDTLITANESEEFENFIKEMIEHERRKKN